MSTQSVIEIHIHPNAPIPEVELRELDTGADALNLASEDRTTSTVVFFHHGESALEDQKLVTLIDDMVHELVRIRTKALRRATDRRPVVLT